MTNEKKNMIMIIKKGNKEKESRLYVLIIEKQKDVHDIYPWKRVKGKRRET